MKQIGYFLNRCSVFGSRVAFLGKKKGPFGLWFSGDLFSFLPDVSWLLYNVQYFRGDVGHRVGGLYIHREKIPHFSWVMFPLIDFWIQWIKCVKRIVLSVKNTLYLRKQQKEYNLNSNWQNYDQMDDIYFEKWFIRAKSIQNTTTTNNNGNISDFSCYPSLPLTFQ